MQLKGLVVIQLTLVYYLIFTLSNRYIYVFASTENMPRSGFQT